LLAGGLIGALGGAGLARCVNLVRGTDRSWVTWNADSLDQLLEAALLRYLAVAHFGRGRGDWAPGESPAHWQPLVHEALETHRDALSALWRRRDPAGGELAAQALCGALQPILIQATRAVLMGLYPPAPLPVSTPLGENALTKRPASQ